MHIKAVPERKADGTRVWATGCEVIPQIDRIGGAIAQISIFFNQDARGQFISPVGDAAEADGHGRRISGIRRLGADHEGQAAAVDSADARRSSRRGGREAREGAGRGQAAPGGQVADTAAGGIQWLEKQVRDYQQYRASFTAAELRAPGVWGDPTGEGRKRLDAEAAALRKLSVADQQQVDALGLESRNLERQAQAEKQEQEHRRSDAPAGAIARTCREGP